MKLVVIGNGVAGITTARSVASQGADIDIHVFSSEPYAYYPRPRLVELLAGELTEEQMALHSRDWYEQRGIHTETARCVKTLGPKEHKIGFADGSVTGYDKLVLATGAHAWVPPIPGADLEGVSTLRTLADALALRDASRQHKRAVIIGGGLLGLDTAVALQANDLKVTVLEVLPWLLPRQLDREGAAVLQGILERRGLRVLTGEQCIGIEGSDRVARLQLKSGPAIDADLVVVSAGVRSNTDLARDAGLACNRGVIVDNMMRTSDSDIYAVGDVAEFNGFVWGIIPAALSQARVAAAQLTGDTTTVYEDIVPSTTLKVTGIDLTSVGEVNADGGDYQHVRYASEAEGIYKKLVVKDGRVVGGILLGDRGDVRAVNRLINRGTDISHHLGTLLQPGTDLMQVANAPGN